MVLEEVTRTVQQGAGMRLKVRQLRGDCHSWLPPQATPFGYWDDWV